MSLETYRKLRDEWNNMLDALDREWYDLTDEERAELDRERTPMSETEGHECCLTVAAEVVALRAEVERQRARADAAEDSDRESLEIMRRIRANRDALRAALLYFRDRGDETDPCWCVEPPRPGEPHAQGCSQARDALHLRSTSYPQSYPQR